MTAPKAIPAPTTLALAAASVLALAAAAPHAAADTKRGIAGGDVGVANALNARWYYRWSGTPPTGFDAFNGQYVPMIWSANPSNIDSKIDTILNLADDYNVQHVLGFNEPERVNQANMSVAQAIDVWEVIDERFEGTGIELVSPANSGGVGEAWLADFMAEAELRDLRVDAIGWHWYGSIGPGTVNSAANNFIGKIDQLYALYNRPIWITEFGGLDFANTISSPDLIQANEDFLDIVIPQLEARDHVVAYAWWQYGQDDNGEERDTLLIEQVDGVWTPTGIGDEYIPTLHTGDTVDINGIDQGADTFYFRGGALTNNGAALTKGAGSVVALESSTSIGGSSDFGIAGGGVFVVPGATLHKDSANTIRILGRGVDNDGDLHLNQGTLQVEAGNITGTGTTHLNAGATLALGNASDRAGVTVAQAVAFNGGTVQTNAIIDGTHQLSAGGQLNADTVFTGNGNLTVAGPITSSANFGLVKDGTGTLTLTASNSYTGDTTLRAGTVALTGSGDLGASPNIRIDAGATLDVSALPSGYTLNNQQLTLDGDIAGNLNATAGSTVNVNSANSLNGSLALDASIATGGGRVTGSLSSANGSTVQVGGDGIDALSASAGIVTTNLTLNFDAALDTPGDAAWDDAATGQSLAFASGVSPIGVNDPALPGLTAAYNIPTTGIAEGLNGYFESGAPVRSTSDATFEVWFNIADTAAAGDQVLFEAGGAGRGVALTLDGQTLSFSVNGDAVDTTAIDAAGLTAGWHHAVGVIDLNGMLDDQANDSMSFYVNNQLVGSVDNLLIDDWAGGNLTGVGDAASSPGAGITPVGYHDAIASVRYYANTAFDANDVGQNFAAVGDPGLPATLTIEGGFTQDTASTLALDIAGAATGEHDLLDVLGTADLAGELSLNLDLGYNPALGDTFTVVNAAGVTGAFDTIDGVIIDPQTGLAVTYDASGVHVRVSTPGDLNFDDIVDIADLTALAQAINTSGNGWITGDFTGDGVVNAADVDLLAGNFAGLTPEVSAQIANLRALSVPEPASAVALLGVALGGLMRRRSMR